MQVADKISTNIAVRPLAAHNMLADLTPRQSQGQYVLPDDRSRHAHLGMTWVSRLTVSISESPLRFGSSTAISHASIRYVGSAQMLT